MGEKKKKHTTKHTLNAPIGQTTYYGTNGQKISGRTIVDQYKNFPPPTDGGTKSSYPHRYGNADKAFSIASGSSTTSYREYPVKADKKAFNYNRKKDFDLNNPGPFRAVTNQRGTFKGVMCHEGKNGNPNAGFFVRCKETYS